jgi:uncharacterized membrane protein YbhN (UPF0104 family)
VTAALLPTVADSISTAARSVIIAGMLAVAIAAGLSAVRPAGAARFMLRVVGKSRVGRKFTSMAVLVLAGGADLLNGRILARNMVMSLAARTCDGLSLTWTAWALGVDLPALAGVLALNSSGALGGLSMLPGGIGVVEVSMSVLLAGFGAAPAAALAATLAARLFTLWLWVAIGLYLLLRGQGTGDR